MFFLAKFKPLKEYNTLCTQHLQKKSFLSCPGLIFEWSVEKRFVKYSLVHLVWPNTESLISQPFMGLSKIWLLLQDPVSPRYVRFFWRYHIFHLLFCPTHAHIIRSSMGVASSICSEAGRLDFSANKSNRPASEQILLAMAMDERMMSACVGQNKSTWWIKTKQPIADSVLMSFCSTNRN